MTGDRLSVRLDDEARQQVEELTRETGQSESEVVRDAIGALYKARRKRRGRPPETVYDLLVREGLLGGCKGLPPDLSTNPKYMEGFGEDRPPSARRRRSADRRVLGRRRTPRAVR